MLRHPIIKVLIFINFSLLAVYGELSSVILAIIFCIIAIIFSKNKSEFVYISPIYLIVMFFLIIIIALPGGKKEDIISAIYTAIRLSLLIISAISFFIYTSIVEIIYVFKKLRLPPQIGYSLGVGFRYIPISIDESFKVILSQKARGLKISLKNLKRINIIIQSLTVPIIIGLLRKIYTNWISLRMRGISPIDDFSKIKYKLQLLDVLIFLISFSIWFIKI